MHARRVLIPLAATAVAAPLMAVSATPASAHKGPTKWDCIAHYESTHRWHINTGNGYYGGLQFSKRTWRAYGGVATTGRKLPNKTSRRQQIRIAKRVAHRGWKGTPPQGGRNAWPNTWGRCH